MVDSARLRRPVVWIVALVVVLLAVTVAVVVITTRKPPTRAACPPGEVRKALDAVSEERIRTSLVRLAGEPGVEVSRHVSAPGNAAAVEWISGTFADAGLSVEKQSFRSGGRRLDNVVATVSGQDDGARVGVGAHLDSISEDERDDAPGADDNASGVAAVLEAARVIRSLPVSCVQTPIDFVAFNDEEEDMEGSVTYARGVSDSLRGFINIDMVGNGDRPCVNATYNRGRDKAVAEQVAVAGDRYGAGLELPVKRYTEDDQDGASFWEEGIPVAYLYECSPNARYHTTRDDVEHLNVTQIAATTKAVVGALLALSAQPSDY